MDQKTQVVYQIPQFGTRYPNFNKISFFKNLAKSVRQALHLSAISIGRKWNLDDLIAILCYCWIRGISIHHACEKMNRQ